MESNRDIPAALEVERAVLGACLLDNIATSKVLSMLEADSFYDAKHRAIFEAVQDLRDAGQEVDTVSVWTYLDQQQINVGADTVSALTNEVSSTQAVEQHCRILQEYKVRRQSITVAKKLLTRARDTSNDVFEVVGQMQKQSMDIIDGVMTGRTKRFTDILREAVDRFERAHNTKDGITGVPSVLREMNKLTAGWQKGDLIYVMARPSQGKTTYALNDALAAAASDIPVDIYSYEMSAVDLTQKLISMAGGIDFQRGRRGELSNDDWKKLIEAAADLHERPVHIDDNMYTPSQLVAVARQNAYLRGTGLIIVDYLQLMPSDGGRNNRSRELGIASKALKTLAKMLNVPVICLVQNNRKVLEQSGYPIPQLYHLRDSGEIEEDGDVVVALWRPERFKYQQYPVVDPSSRREMKVNTRNLAEFVIQKQRNGPRGTVHATFVGKYSRFRDFAYDQAATPSQQQEMIPDPDDEMPF